MIMSIKCANCGKEGLFVVTLRHTTYYKPCEHCHNVNSSYNDKHFCNEKCFRAWQTKEWEGDDALERQINIMKSDLPNDWFVIVNKEIKYSGTQAKCEAWIAKRAFSQSWGELQLHKPLGDKNETQG